ncbi:glycoside hydrolase family 43 protein [Pedobacter alpinus]|uniref:Glycoside hydrolase family 43 protein n=1 Tax=Pedobacter alpinus TaxID=1590643 RepID=A0ABW5TWX4_9SPHI
MKIEYIILSAIVLATSACAQNGKTTSSVDSTDKKEQTSNNLFEGAISQPLITERYSADPSAHVFDGKIFIYPSHDYDAGIADDDSGDQYLMKDYYVYSLDSVGGKVKDYPVALTLQDVPWAAKQMWAPDAAFKNGKYYFYFPAKDKQGVFRIGVAESDQPQGPFKAQPLPIENSFSIDPAVFTDTDGQSYMYFGGIWGGQLQKWATGKFDANGSVTDLKQDKEPALTAKIAKMASSMKEFAEAPKDVVILDENGKPILGGDHDRRFFEASWMHKYKGKYYFSYSTGDTHLVCYATGDNPYGPFTYQGVILIPVIGWTSHHSIVEFKGKSYLFYHDTQISGGTTHLRNVKVTELHYDADGKILPIAPYVTSKK